MLPVNDARYVAAPGPTAAQGWRLDRVTAPSRLYGANGLRTGPDGRIYVAQVTGSQISALDVESGRLETISPKGGEIIAPDDVAFDSAGNLFATEVMDGRVSVREANGRTRVLRDDLPLANGITVHQDRLFVNESRMDGRLMEIDRGTGAVRVLLEGLLSPNAMEVGPDGMLYYPLTMANEIWRIDPEGGEPQRVVGDLGFPVAVKFDAKGNIVSAQIASGQVLRIDPRSGDKTVLAQLNPGLDNLTFVGDRLFVSSLTGEITEITAGGVTNSVLTGGLNWPLDVAVGDDGRLYVADGNYFYAVLPDGSLQTVGMLFSPGFPGFLRGLTADGAGAFIVTTAGGQVARYRPHDGETDSLADGLDELYGVAIGPGGAIAFAESGTGKVRSFRRGSSETLASGLRDPAGVAFGPDGAVLVAESGAGHIVRLAAGSAETVVDGLERPQGIVVVDDQLYIVDADAKEVVAVDLASGQRATIAFGLPVGAPPGVKPKPLKGMPPLTGPQGPFSGITAGADGTLYVSADGDGSVLALRETEGMEFRLKIS